MGIFLKPKSDLRGDEPSYKTEIVPFDKAPWATQIPGQHFRWAWRILGLDGSVRASGVSNAAEKDVKAATGAAAQRMRSYRVGEYPNKLKTAKQRAQEAANSKADKEIDSPGEVGDDQ